RIRVGAYLAAARQARYRPVAGSRTGGAAARAGRDGGWSWAREDPWLKGVDGKRSVHVLLCCYGAAHAGLAGCDERGFRRPAWGGKSAFGHDGLRLHHIRALV